MAKKTTKESKEIVPVVQPKKELVLEGDPEKQLEFAIKASNALMKAVSSKKNPVMIRGEQYLEYGDWQMLARFFGATAAIEWTQPLIDDKTTKTLGYEARAQVLHNGVVISSAEAMCLRSEKNWRDRDEFMLRSMAQTRAAAKALRNAYGWVAELAGLKSTPAEEMDGIARDKVNYRVERIKDGDSDDEQGHTPHTIHMDEKSPREVIAALLRDKFKYDVVGKSAEEVRSKVRDLTGIEMAPQNYSDVVIELQWKS